MAPWLKYKAWEEYFREENQRNWRKEEFLDLQDSDSSRLRCVCLLIIKLYLFTCVNNRKIITILSHSAVWYLYKMYWDLNAYGCYLYRCTKVTIYVSGITTKNYSEVFLLFQTNFQNIFSTPIDFSLIRGFLILFNFSMTANLNSAS